MKIIELIAENYKKLRVVEITPKGHVVQITGKNGQGKTSVLDAIWTALAGAKATPEKPVRKGAERTTIKLNLGELQVTRIITGAGSNQLTVEAKNGSKITSPQKVLDELLGQLSFDPLAFIGMKPKEQIEELRKVAKIDVDVDAITALNKADYDARTDVNRDVRRLESELSTITVQDGLPKEKVDEAEILHQLNLVGSRNKEIGEILAEKSRLKYAYLEVERSVDAENNEIDLLESEIEKLETTLKAKRESLKEKTKALKYLETKQMQANKAANDAPEPDFINTNEITAQLQQAQMTNREIDKRTRRDGVQAQLREKQRAADTLTRGIEAREEKKREALKNAAMPIEGLSFDDSTVTFNGIPIEQLGEAEAIRISTAIAMAANPKLRVIRILHGEALDEDSLAIIAKMAEEHDFQVWMAKVDSTGKVGIVMEDGMVKEENE